jgi:integrase
MDPDGGVAAVWLVRRPGSPDAIDQACLFERIQHQWRYLGSGGRTGSDVLLAGRPSTSQRTPASLITSLKQADLEVQVRVHDLRHAHASWLLAGGADLQVVKERLGHADIATTARYLHTLPEADETALDALASIRNRAGKSRGRSTAKGS